MGNRYIRVYNTYNSYHKIAAVAGSDSYSLVDTVQKSSGELTYTYRNVAALCYVNDYGDCKGFAWQCDYGGTKVSKSCYASVYGGTKT